MVSYLILCRSLTYAQRTAGILEQVGIKGRVSRLPHSLAGEGCGYCVKIAERNLDRSLEALKEAGMRSKRVFLDDDSGSFSEVTL